MAGVKGRSGGRNRKTDAEKKKLGVRKDRINDNAPDVVNDRIVKFKEFGAIGEAIFDHFEPMLYTNGTLSATDSLAFHQLCQKYDDWYNAVKRCKKRGRYEKQINSKTGAVTMVETPWSKNEKVFYDQLIKTCREFGMTPVSRSAVDKIKRAQKENPFQGVT